MRLVYAGLFLMCIALIVALYYHHRKAQLDEFAEYEVFKDANPTDVTDTFVLTQSGDGEVRWLNWSSGVLVNETTYLIDGEGNIIRISPDTWASKAEAERASIPINASPVARMFSRTPVASISLALGLVVFAYLTARYRGGSRVKGEDTNTPTSS